MLKLRLNRPAQPAAGQRESVVIRAVNNQAALRLADHERWRAERLYRTHLPAGHF